ncbi:Matrixin [Polystyrenella longa]|uniref:Matrixin n=1 Tax=Polystyrenella longa TaxID=2528007 RepID=A0A518CPC4_9PLAN|nr:nidogen-like domain-containing protein [Polystyrenella longa]QDU81071.1 Matrixin [Polystyrenella longa]
MQRSVWSRAVNFFTRAQQPVRKTQPTGDWGGSAVELLETRTLLSSVNLFSAQLSPAQDQETSHSQSVSVALDQSNESGETVTYEVGINSDPMELVAKKVDELHGLYATETYVGTNYHFDRRGEGEKYMLGETGWYFLLPNGEVYRWNRNLSESHLVASLDTEYYDNPELLYTAADSTDMEQMVADLDEQWDFHATDKILKEDFYLNHRGQQEKYFKGGKHWFYITPDGAAYRWHGSFEKSVKYFQFDESYYEDVTKLFNANESLNVSGSGAEAGIQVNGKDIQITPTKGFVGTFNYTIVATDGFQVGQTTNTIDVQNSAPVLRDVGEVEFMVYPDGIPEHAVDVLFDTGTTEAEVAEILAAQKGEYFTIDLESYDLDGDSISISAMLEGADAVQLNQEYSLHADARTVGKNYFYNLRGANEKYVQTSRGWIYMLPNGEAYYWYGSLEKSALVAELDPAYYEDPSLLWNTEIPAEADVAIQLNGSKLTIDPANDFVGEFSIVITATDGLADSEIVIPVSIVDGQDLFDSFVFDDADRWTTTATDAGVLSQGDSTILTWTIAPDGTFIDSYTLGTGANSNLISFLDNIYGDDGSGDIANRSWFPFIQSSFDSWADLTGITYEYVEYDDGSDFELDNAGVLNTRADIRLGGRPIDGDSGVLAFNFFPNFGEMVIDTSDSTFDNTNSDSLVLRNVVAHELGHGLGFAHQFPVDQTVLMEPFLSTAFDGPQFDDLLAANRGYGDRFEVGTGNDTVSVATDLGFVDDTVRVINSLSIDGSADRDYFFFDISYPQAVTITVNPIGGVYQNGDTAADVADFDAGAQSNLEFMLLDGDGITVLGTADAAAIGNPETLTFDLPSSGTYYVRIIGQEDAAQMYQLDISTQDGVDGGSISGFVYEDRNNNGTRDSQTGTVPNIELLDIGDVILERNDDLSTDLLDFGFDFEFYGTTYDSFYINNNGNITFDAPLFDFVPDGFPTFTPIIAPFWADVDTTGAGSAEVHLARGTSSRGNPIVQIDWPGVGYFFANDTQLNNFTLYIEDDPEGDIVVFSYGDMEWTTGEVESNGGFGGQGAQIGADSGDGVNYFSLGRPNSPDTLAAFTNTQFEFRVTDFGFTSIEPGIADVTVYLDTNNNGNLDVGEITSITREDDTSTPDIDETGFYEFTGLAAGTFVVRQIIPEDFVQTEPINDGPHIVELANGEVEEQRNFGNFAGIFGKQITLETAADYQISEAGSIEVIATIVGHPQNVDTNVQLDFSGTAILDVDYTVTSTLITIPAGQTSGSIVITGIDDSRIEIRESIIVDVISSDSAGELNGLQQVTVFMTDNDNPSPAMGVGESGHADLPAWAANSLEGGVPLHRLATLSERKVAFVNGGRHIITAYANKLSPLIDVNEGEGSGTSGDNDAQADAEFLDGFGTGILDDPQADVSGNLGSLSDVDYYSFDLEAGDVIGVTGFNSLTTIQLFDPTGTERVGSSQDLSAIYPNASPLPGGGNATIAYVVPTAGTYAVAISGFTGDYSAQFRVFRPDLETQAAGAVQTLFIDFDGATLDASIFGGSGSVTLSPLTTFLGDWGLTAADEDAVIDAILAELERSISTDIRLNGNNGDFDTTGINGDFDIEILNSRDDADPFGQDNVSRVVVGGTIAELGIPTIGIAESIDPGNFNQEESAVVLLDFLSGPNDDPNSLNAIPLAAGVSIIDLIGTAVGNITSHEAGHFFGLFHTDQTNPTENLIDQGGDLSNTIGLGPDGIYGSADDVDVSHVTDVYVENEGFTGIEDTLNSLAFGLSTGGGNGGNTGGRNPQVTLEVLESPSLNFTEGESRTIVASIVGHPDDGIILIEFSFSGSAVLGTDYQVSSEQIIILPGESSGSITIFAIDERLIEIRESIIIDIDSITGGDELNDFQQATVFILDNDAPAPLIAATPPGQTPTNTTASTGSNSGQASSGSSSPWKSRFAFMPVTEEGMPKSKAAVVYAEEPVIDDKSVDDSFSLLSDEDIWV